MSVGIVRIDDQYSTVGVRRGRQVADMAKQRAGIEPQDLVVLLEAQRDVVVHQGFVGHPAVGEEVAERGQLVRRGFLTIDQIEIALDGRILADRAGTHRLLRTGEVPRESGARGRRGCRSGSRSRRSSRCRIDRRLLLRALRAARIGLGLGPTLLLLAQVLLDTLFLGLLLVRLRVGILGQGDARRRQEQHSQQ